MLGLQSWLSSVILNLLQLSSVMLARKLGLLSSKQNLEKAQSFGAWFSVLQSVAGIFHFVLRIAKTRYTIVVLAKRLLEYMSIKSADIEEIRKHLEGYLFQERLIFSVAFKNGIYFFFDFVKLKLFVANIFF